jgi:3-isopropylmalate dehydrogenase
LRIIPRCPEVASAIDLLIVRELNGDVYFGEKGFRTTASGEREGYDVMSYSESEVRRIAHVAFRAARTRAHRVCSVDKANVLETSQLWRDVIVEVAKEYPDVTLDHMYVDNAAMQLVRNPGQFDVMVTGNLFGDILSDQASMCVGSIGMLASASLGERQTEYGTFGLYEPITAPRPTSPARPGQPDGHHPVRRDAVAPLAGSGPAGRPYRTRRGSRAGRRRVRPRSWRNGGHDGNW